MSLSYEKNQALKMLDPPTDKTRLFGCSRALPERVWTEAKPGTALSPVFTGWLINQHILCRTATGRLRDGEGGRGGTQWTPLLLYGWIKAVSLK